MNEHEKLLEMSKPLIDYLKENYHPHTAIVVTEERVMVVETSVSVPSVDPVSGSDQETKTVREISDEVMEILKKEHLTADKALVVLEAVRCRVRKCVFNKPL